MKNMQKQGLQTLKGFRDFLPEEKRQRDLVAGKIKRTFELYGFEPLETPTLEYASLLMGKYGAEADKLVYSFEDRGGRQVALRYDQTVPTARVLSEYQDKLGKCFRRYQIQNVFRADKPQKGRYREFTQCDADIFGTISPLADAEILSVYAQIYLDLGIKDLVIELNDRETLVSNLKEYESQKVKVASIIQSVDKLDKLSQDEVVQELIEKGLDASQAEAALEAISQAKPSSNLEEIIKAAKELVPEINLKFNPSLARGLDYYTGMIFEGKVPGFAGSVGGGGRYDKLIESLGGPSISAVGFGLGFDRTVEILIERGLVETQSGVQALVLTLGKDLEMYALQLAAKLRSEGINSELYPDQDDKLDRMLKYGGKKGIKYALILGEEELKNNSVTLKNLVTRDQQTISVDKAVKLLSNGQ